MVRLFGPGAALERTVALVNAVAEPDADALVARTFSEFGDDVSPSELADEWDATLAALNDLRRVMSIADPDDAAAAINVALDAWTGPLQLVTEPGAAWHLHADPPGPDRLATWLRASSVLALAVAFAEHGRPAWATCSSSGCDRLFLVDGPGRPRQTCSPRCASRRRQAAYRARARPVSKLNR